MPQKKSEFIARFKELCTFARSKALADGEQTHVVSYMDGERILQLVTMRELPLWVEQHIRNRPFIHYSSAPEIS